MNDTLFTFWKLLGAYRIEIPMIQRDYAQGREGGRAGQVRQTFLAALSNAVRERRPLNLEFVYGRVDDSGKLVLLDGQQRITTLFLLHWYLALRAGRLDDDVRRTLLKFSYATRVNSRAFCHALVKADPPSAGDNLPAAITNAPWFFRSWEQDPTIKAMLIMLGDLAKLSEDGISPWGDLAAAWDALTNPELDLVGFQFLETNSFGLTDELYLKMNARGKALTDFENFKAWLQSYVVNETITVPTDWTDRLDTDWLDLFWRFRPSAPKSGEETDATDDALLQFFKGMALNTALSREPATATMERPEKPRVIEEADITRFNTPGEYIQLQFYEQHRMFDRDSLVEIFRVLDTLAADGHARVSACLEGVHFFSDDVKRHGSLFEGFISPQVTFQTRAAFYGLARFLAHLPEGVAFDPAVHGEALRAWMRLVRNLASNVTVDAGTFARVIRSLRDLARVGSHDIDSYLVREGAKSANRWGGRMDEEAIKARLILPVPDTVDTAWRDALCLAENHEYFAGRVGFLLEFAREDETYNLQAFRDYAAKASAIFQVPDSPCMDTPDFWLHRALLSKCDVEGVALFGASSVVENYSFGRDRDEWNSKLLQNNDSQRPSWWLPLLVNLKATLDEIAVGNEKEGLEAIVQRSHWEPDDWRGWFIHCPQVIDYCQYRIFRFDDYHKVFPFMFGSMGFRHSELRSHVFYYHHLQTMPDSLKALGHSDYWNKTGYANSEDNWPCAIIKGNVYKTKLRYGSPWDEEIRFTVEFYPVKFESLHAPWETELTRDLGFVDDEKTNGYRIRLDADEQRVLNKLLALAEVVHAHCPENV